jgi:3-dehydroquinate synthase
MADSIVLIGFMGAGKDAVGKELARRTGMAFISIDRVIELMQNRTITDIFAHEGEGRFRAYEQAALSAVGGISSAVVATGGGIVLRPENRALLKKSGTVVHLQASLETVQERLKGYSARPLAVDPGQIAQVYREREGMYDFADRTYITDQKTPAAVTEKILRDLQITVASTTSRNSTVVVKTPYKEYPVICGSGPQAYTPFKQAVIKDTDHVCLVTNPLVGGLYLDPFYTMLEDNGCEVEHVIIPDGESFKTLATASRLYDHLMKIHFSLSGLVIGMGGGVITDVTGFVAGTYKRGVRCAFIATTLLGQVDAAIGGKNGIDHAQGKNMIGTFYQPEWVIDDVMVLGTLSDREFRNGMAEVIKYAITHDHVLFSMLEQNHHKILARDPALLQEVITRCIRIKSKIVARDERETLGIRCQLNFGHTIGHAIETLFKYQHMSHGQAIAIGMTEEAKAAMNRGYLDRKHYLQIIDLIRLYDLPYTLPSTIGIEEIRATMLHDKKTKGETITLPIPVKIGTVSTKEVSCKTYW